MLLLVGWRGEPGKYDEPQHYVQGDATVGQLTQMGVPFAILPDFIEGAERALQVAKTYVKGSLRKP
jgi:phosphonopyruvate decarboxylase